MAKGKYKKDQSLDSSTYKSPSMITSEFQGVTEGEVFKRDLAIAEDDTLSNIKRVTGGLTGMSLMETLLFGLSGDDDKLAYEQAMDDKADNPEGYLSIFRKNRIQSDALAQKSDFDEGVDGMISAIGDNVVTYKLDEGGSFLEPTSWQLPDRYKNLSVEQRNYIKTGIADTLRNAGYSESTFDTVNMGDTESMVFSKQQINENYGRFGIRRKKDTFEGQSFATDNIESFDDNVMREKTRMEKAEMFGEVVKERGGEIVEDIGDAYDKYKPTFNIAKGKISEGADFLKDKLEKNVGILKDQFANRGRAPQNNSAFYNTKVNNEPSAPIIPEKYSGFAQELRGQGVPEGIIAERVANQIKLDQEANERYSN